jgi:DNA-binding LytR/AlgR family response regulator
MLNCYIADDEPAAVNILKHFVSETPGLMLVGNSCSALEALDFIMSSEAQIDIAFVDVSMPKLSGIEMAKLVRDRTNVIITTAFSEYGHKAFEADVCDYLIKPIAYEKFLRSINKVRKHIEKSITAESRDASYFFIQSDNKGKIIKVNIEEIIYIEAALNYIEIHLSNNRKHLTYLTMSEILQSLPENFVRIHKSHIVDVSRISFLSGNNLNLENKIILSVGSSYKKALHDIIAKKLIKTKRG